MKELEIKDWRGKVWRVQFEKHLADGEWAIDWKVLIPDGSVRSEIESDRELPLKNICANLCKIRRHAVLTTSRRILTDLSKLPEGIDSSR
ncbi:hypothetical protein [Coleofasciculus sp.]|uniref:hypothetical protein n=1 Tax=Coleofasciculus sp. TaxID=3100458 RepID=UPI003A1DA0F2